MPPRSSSLLIAEPPLIVLPTLATLAGLNEAIFLQQLHYWILRSGKERDGRLWIYNTYDEWQAQLPFWSRATLRRIVNGLEERGLILSTDVYNASKVEKSSWPRMTNVSGSARSTSAAAGRWAASRILRGQPADPVPPAGASPRTARPGAPARAGCAAAPSPGSARGAASA